MATMLIESATTDFGPRGGDPRRGVDMDLSTCVNRYGPAPAAVSALHHVVPADIVLHPYDASDQMIDVYRWVTDVRYGAMIAGRGATEFIWAMGRELAHDRVRVPLPAYTDYLKVFPGRGFSVAGERIPSIEQLDAALAGGHVVIVSNPHNPTGALLDPDDLVAVANARPESILVVDESYVGFTPYPSSASVIGCDAPNVVVLQSTANFYGIAATRTGIAWCADAEVLSWLFGRRENWGLSGVDVRAACAAVRDVDWAEECRRQLLVDSAWLAELLSRVDGLDAYVNANVHYQYAWYERAANVAEALAARGIGVCVLGRAHGVAPDGLRIVAPRVDERQLFAAAVRDALDVIG